MAHTTDRQTDMPHRHTFSYTPDTHHRYKHVHTTPHSHHETTHRHTFQNHVYTRKLSRAKALGWGADKAPLSVLGSP